MLDDRLDGDAMVEPHEGRREIADLGCAIGFASLRGGTIAGDHDVMFLGPDERLILSHRAESRMIFARGALTAARFLAGLIYGTSPGDPVVFAGVPIILFAAVLTAGYIPAHRATRVDPLAALRYE